MDKVFVINPKDYPVNGFPPRSMTRIDSMETAKRLHEESNGNLKFAAEEILSLNEFDAQYLKFPEK